MGDNVLLVTIVNQHEEPRKVLCAVGEVYDRTPVYDSVVFFLVGEREHVLEECRMDGEDASV